MRVPVSQPTIGDDERRLINAALNSNQLTQGPLCELFETSLAMRLATSHAVVTSSGTTALHLALAALNIGPGDEVIIPDITFVATGNAVLYTGATPVIADVSLDTWCIDPSSVAARITDRTRAVLIVHLYGVSCDMEGLRAVIPPDIHIVEDAAEGFGGSYSNGDHAGLPLGCAHVSTFSFYGNKILTTGEGGAVVTNSPDINARLRYLRGQAMSTDRRYFHTEVGYNYRMGELQAAIGLGQLQHINQMLAGRRAVIERYASQLDYPAPCAQPYAAPWLYTLLLDTPHSRDVAMRTLAINSIETRPCFVPLHRMPMFGSRPDDEYPNASTIADRALSLPTYPFLPLEVVDEICGCVRGDDDG